MAWPKSSCVTAPVLDEGATAAFLGRVDCLREADLGVVPDLGVVTAAADADAEASALASLLSALGVPALDVARDLGLAGVLELDFLVVAGDEAVAGSTDSLLVDLRAIVFERVKIYEW